MVDDYKELLQVAARAPVAAFQFFITTPERPSTTFLFCEGEDDILFYMSMSKAVGFSNVVPIDCGNKDGVLTLHQMIGAQTTRRSDYLCFCDSDFDPFIPRLAVKDSRLFFTRGYSVECYFRIDEVLSILLNQVSGIVWDEQLVSQIIGDSSSKYRKFSRLHLVLSAYAIDEIRKAGRNPLSDLSFDSVLRSRQGKVVFNPEKLEEMRRIFSRRHQKDYRAYIEELGLHDSEKYVRGKYHIRMIWLLVREAYNIIQKKYSTSPISGRGVKRPASAQGVVFFENLSARIAVPRDLRDFLTPHVC